MRFVQGILDDRHRSEQNLVTAPRRALVSREAAAARRQAGHWYGSLERHRSGSFMSRALQSIRCVPIIELADDRAISQ